VDALNDLPELQYSYLRSIIRARDPNTVTGKTGAAAAASAAAFEGASWSLSLTLACR
jgi:hypothetical protein